VRTANPLEDEDDRPSKRKKCNSSEYEIFNRGKDGDTTIGPVREYSGKYSHPVSCSATNYHTSPKPSPPPSSKQKPTPPKTKPPTSKPVSPFYKSILKWVKVDTR